MNFSIKRMRCVQIALVVMVSSGFQAAVAEPWIEAGDQQARHHLQVLADANHINLPLTSWPLMWNAVTPQLGALDSAALTANELRSYKYLRHQLNRAQQKVKQGAQISVGNGHPGLTDFAVDSRERWETRSYGTYTGGRWAFKLQGSAVGDPIDGQRYRLDGSYLAVALGDWVVGAGAVDQWWSPGWQSSLILSNAARPSPGVFVRRAGSRPFDLPVLEWLGPWGAQMFFNQLEGNRATPHAKLLGMRVNFKPFQSLEIGLSRTAQWGGEGRPQDWGSFWKTLVGQSNRGSDGLAEDGSDEPANQLAGYDWRLSHSINGVSGAFYGQLIGEDEAGGLPYKFLGMAGAELSFSAGTTHNRVAFEASNTTMEFNKGVTPNVAYEHPRYPSGYRYRGRPVGASTDNDSELAVVKGFHYLANGHHLRWTVGAGKINADGGDTSLPQGGNVWANQAVDLQYATAQYSFPLWKAGEVGLGLQYYSEPLTLRGEQIDSGAHLTYRLLLDGGRH